MNIKRRLFLKTAITGMTLSAISGSSLTSCFSNQRSPEKGFQDFGIQLYSLKDVMPSDPKAVLQQLAHMGYTQIESYEGEQGMFWGFQNKAFKKFTEDIGLNIVSSHCSIDKFFERKAGEAAEIGMKYLIVPSVGPQGTLEDFKRIADQFNEAGEICKKAGLRFAYHNHAYSFTLLEGEFPQDVLMQNTNPDTVDYEMDIYWVDTAGADPLAWFEKYPGRFRLCHIKDRLKNAPKDEENYSCELGKGELDFTKILTSGKEHGLDYFLVEQERFDHITSLEAAAANARFLKRLVI